MNLRKNIKIVSLHSTHNYRMLPYTDAGLFVADVLQMFFLDGRQNSGFADPA
jgi:hypothetical protein